MCWITTPPSSPPHRMRSTNRTPIAPPTTTRSWSGLFPTPLPLWTAGGPYSVDEGGSVTLAATGSDPNGDSLTYAWDLDNNGSFETSGQSVTFAASLLDGPSSYTVQVKATDPLRALCDSQRHRGCSQRRPDRHLAGTDHAGSCGRGRCAGQLRAPPSLIQPVLRMQPYTCNFDWDDDGAVDQTVSATYGDLQRYR